MKISAAWIAAALCFSTAPAQADTFGSGDRTRTFSIKSDRLDEAREIFVRTPVAYDPEKTYPVVYVLDGEWNFDYVAAYLDYMADNEVYPALIVAGVRNVNRNRDYVPAPDQWHPHTGEADRFLQFVESEWIPAVEKKYPASGERILIGHSFGGVFTLHTLFSKPDLFDAYIALGSSAWIADRVLFNEADAFFQSGGAPGAFVYMAVGEGDGGPTVPSSKDLAAVFEEKADDALDWTFAITPKTDHFKNFASGMHDAFMALFPAWGFDGQVMEAAQANGAAGVEAWFAQKESELGWRFLPAWFDMGIAAGRLSRDDKGEAAKALMAAMRRHYPDSPFVASFSATIFQRTGDLDAAESEIRRAIAITKEKKLDPNAMQLASLEETLAEIIAAREAN